MNLEGLKIMPTKERNEFKLFQYVIFFLFFFFLYRCHQITEWRQMGLDYIFFFSFLFAFFLFLFLILVLIFFVLFAGYFKQFKTHHQVRWLLVLNSLAWNRYYLNILTPPRPTIANQPSSICVLCAITSRLLVILNQISLVMSGYPLRL